MYACGSNYQPTKYSYSYGSKKEGREEGQEGCEEEGDEKAPLTLPKNGPARGCFHFTQIKRHMCRKSVLAALCVVIIITQNDRDICRVRAIPHTPHL